MNDTLKTILNGLKTSFDSELRRVKKAVNEALSTARTAAASADGKMNAENPVGSGSFSMNQSKDSVIGDYSHAEGFRCTASGGVSHAEGRASKAEGYASHAEGFLCTASGDQSHAEGDSCTASGDYSHAEGFKCTASGDQSHAEGGSCTASGEHSHAEGGSCTASGEHSHAEGFNCTASGEHSHAEGFRCTASGDHSHAEGNNTVAASDYQHVEGKDNIEDSEGKYIHIVGNATLPNSRSNAHTIDWNGLGWFAGGLKVGGTGQDDEAAVEVALKSQVYTQAEVNELVSAIPKFKVEVVDILPSWGEASNTTIYLVPEPKGDNPNLYSEYIYMEKYKGVRGDFELLGTQTLDLTGYATETWVEGQLADCQPAGDYALKSDLENVKPSAAAVNPLTKALFNDYTLLYKYARTGSLGEKEEFNDAALSESIQNFTMLYVMVTSNQFILDSTYIPVSMFGITLPDVSDRSYFELNSNDQQNLFGGNVRYASDTTISGKIVGNTKALLVYGIGRVAN